MTHYIYIPGLGDRFDPLRRFVLLGWRRHDARTTLIPMRWTDKSETYEQKQARIVEAIQQLGGEEIVLVGESAGGPMALLTLSRHPAEIHSVVTICGYNRGAPDIHPVRRRRNPAFYPLMLEIDKIMPRLPKDTRQRVTTIYSTLDNVVTTRHSEIEGARKIVLHTPGHFLSIARALLTGPKRLK